MWWNSKEPKNNTLEKLLKDNKRKLKINRDGFVSIDLTSEEAMKAIREQVEKIEDVAVKA
ncbi:TPA: hypothetical protein ACGVAR_002222 [Vibrio vulnificus]|uniref:hypothetical protein n=1 Tax=Vibrio vulnificus TaxID=672 RepID=UPI001A18021C|nr:hypothetical protein [Vibrio navarrensis]EKA7355640.1 hypothetical protein [Vibrio vulnificus]HAS6220120.1 hypothetical protein [Vibrio vulnificus]HDY7701683.1 hypothetical protein [Vibrio vulnificus]HDY7881531.1 hypothetical protein [Vibrio vulnificus]